LGYIGLPWATLGYLGIPWATLGLTFGVHRLPWACLGLLGVLGVLWFIFWAFLCFDSPAKHPRISSVRYLKFFFFERSRGGNYEAFSDACSAADRVLKFSILYTHIEGSPAKHPRISSVRYLKKQFFRAPLGVLGPALATLDMLGRA
jgi:hypothetical protein